MPEILDNEDLLLTEDDWCFEHENWAYQCIEKHSLLLDEVAIDVCE